MFCSRISNAKINRVHERALHIAYNDYTNSYEDLLKLVGSETKHFRNIKKVALEMFKVKRNISPQIMKDIFEFREELGTRSGAGFRRIRNRTVTGEMSLSSFGPIVWNEILPREFKCIENLFEFKAKLKTWIPICKCRLCRIYVQRVGFID